jgi:hypothetical protein
MNRILISLTSLVFLSSCFKEKPVDPIDISTQGKRFVASMGSNYEPQLYFNLQTAQFTGQHSRFDYDLAFDCNSSKFGIWLNGAKLMMATKTNKTNMNEVSADDTLQTNWRVEFGYGTEDSAAIGRWGFYPTSDKKVYLINLGNDKNGNGLGFRKFQVLDYTTGYNIAYSNIDGSGYRQVFVPKDNDRQFVFYSMINHVARNLEPAKDNWDLVFTMYSTYFYAEKLPYIVNGVLTNNERTKAYLMDSVTDYNNITIDDVQLERFNNKRDGIGFEWKVYDLGEYYINSKKNYIIQSDGRFFKLRLIDFYKDGERGFPTFAYEELK